MKTLSGLLLLLLLLCCARPPAAQAQPSGPMVCCEIFGYGAMMKKCCTSYQRMPQAECTVDSHLTGGGREVVADSYCK